MIIDIDIGARLSRTNELHTRYNAMEFDNYDYAAQKLIRARISLVDYSKGLLNLWDQEYDDRS